jgi:hypothetical protein
MQLHKKQEMKETLTEHLFVIIQQVKSCMARRLSDGTGDLRSVLEPLLCSKNEMRKSKKLEDLMAKLQLSEEDALKEIQAEVYTTHAPPPSPPTHVDCRSNEFPLTLPSSRSTGRKAATFIGGKRGSVAAGDGGQAGG